MEDSGKKAKILSEAAGTKLGDIVSIDYSWGQVEFVSRPVDTLGLDLPDVAEDEYISSIDVDIEPDDIDVSDTVTVIWSLQ